MASCRRLHFSKPNDGTLDEILILYQFILDKIFTFLDIISTVVFNQAETLFIGYKRLGMLKFTFTKYLSQLNQNIRCWNLYLNIHCLWWTGSAGSNQPDRNRTPGTVGKDSAREKPTQQFKTFVSECMFQKQGISLYTIDFANEQFFFAYLWGYIFTNNYSKKVNGAVEKKLFSNSRVTHCRCYFLWTQFDTNCSFNH